MGIDLATTLHPVLAILLYLVAGTGAGVLTGLASLSAAVAITPLLVSLAGWESYDAVCVALTSDVLASAIAAWTYHKHGNIDITGGIKLACVALVGAVVGSWFGFLFSQESPDGIGYLSMASTIFLGVKFLVQPVTDGHATQDAAEAASPKRVAAALICVLPIGFVCGFTGAGGGALMLLLLTMVVGYDLKTAVGTSALVMSTISLVGGVSHVAMGATIHTVPLVICVASCLAGTQIAARFANRCDDKVLNRIVGLALLAIGLFTLLFKVL